MTVYIGFGDKCAICTSEMDCITDWTIKFQRVFNRDLKSSLVCKECWDKIKINREEFLCKLPGCRVLKEPESDYCCRHDENSTIELPIAPKIE